MNSNAPTDAGAAVLECMDSLSGEESDLLLLQLFTKLNVCLISAPSLSSVQKLIGPMTSHPSFSVLLSSLCRMATNGEPCSVVALTCLQALVYSQEALKALSLSQLPAHLLGLLKASTSSCRLEPVIVLTSLRLLAALVKADCHLVDERERLIDKHAAALSAIVAFYLAEKSDGSISCVEPSIELLEAMVIRREGAKAVLASEMTNCPPTLKATNGVKNAVRVARSVVGSN